MDFMPGFLETGYMNYKYLLCEVCGFTCHAFAILTLDLGIVMRKMLRVRWVS